ncbi:MAG: hypothetical protein KatS3mg022_0694 [Armatimonadota bacterium]|nr:MAG: hypothetical protein KatS3mg022_0694 [Armatimonadota bacterium]
MSTWQWLFRQPEGQFLERKSCYDRSSATPTTALHQRGG